MSHKDLKMDETQNPGYVDAFDPEAQVSAEEWIAATLFDYDGEGYERPDEEDCRELSQRILLGILSRFRPDLVGYEDEPNSPNEVCDDPEGIDEHGRCAVCGLPACEP